MHRNKKIDIFIPDYCTGYNAKIQVKTLEVIILLCMDLTGSCTRRKKTIV